MDLFLHAAAREARDAGIAKHYLTDPGRDYIARARLHAKAIIMRKGWADINDIRESCGDPPQACAPTIMGAVFRSKDFECIGYFPNPRKTCHARPIARFRLGDAA